jgi:hypothetical protein
VGRVDTRLLVLQPAPQQILSLPRSVLFADTQELDNLLELGPGDQP